MVDGHEVRSIADLHRDATELYNMYVIGGSDSSADTILNNLYKGIENLKTNWKGSAAGVRIQEVVRTYNAMVGVRNALAELAVASSKVASNYRLAERASGAMVEELSVLSFDAKTNLSDYTDTADTVFIDPSAEIGKSNIDAANNAIDSFINNVTTKKDQILNNWVKGTGRDVADSSFSSFVSTVSQYKEKLETTSNNIAIALQNYNNI